MRLSIEGLLQSWEGVGVVTKFDAVAGAWIFISMHDDSLGKMTGGTRVQSYATPEEGLIDSMRLAEGMTYKWAGLGVRAGGAKAVLAIPNSLTADGRRDLMLRYGDLVESLSGTFRTGEDMGTTSEDMLVIASRTSHVEGFDEETGEKIDPSPFTSRGVASGVRAALACVFGDSEPKGKKILIQGLGKVGWALAMEMADQGADLLVNDLDSARLARAVDEFSAEPVPASALFGTPCDVYSPCAVGGSLTRETIGQLACRIVVGSANNQLGEPADAERLHDRGILYVPDYIVNAGGALAFALLGEGVRGRQEILSRAGKIGETVTEILNEAERRAESPVVAACRRIETTLLQARAALGRKRGRNECGIGHLRSVT